MPLKKGIKNIGKNIKELEEHGKRKRSKKQIIAIALNVANKSKKKNCISYFKTMYDEKGMPCIDEYKFLPNRKFRIDHYFPQVNLAIEEEGGIFINGSHCRPMRFCSDMEKYNLMTENGISLLRYQPRKIDHDQIKRVYDRLSLKQKV